MEGFKEEFEKLQIGLGPAIRAEIMQQLGWSRSTFDKKRAGTRKLTKAEETILKTIFEGFGINI